MEKPGVEDPSIHSTLRSTARSTGRRSGPGSAAIGGGRPTHETARHSRPGSAVVGGRSKVRGRTQSLVPVAHEVHTHTTAMRLTNVLHRKAIRMFLFSTEHRGTAHRVSETLTRTAVLNYCVVTRDERQDAQAVSLLQL